MPTLKKTFTVKDEGGETRQISVGGNDCRMLEQLRAGPVECPSRRRHSAEVHRLRKNQGVNIRTERIDDGGGAWHGRYHLISEIGVVRDITETGAA
ncbi:hypothetical protein [Ruegeria sp. HKCCA5491]|uniref:winged helix domain-containing protein n=1 Tax=Ruegeria sp. HKCCA5491 TaxID=2682986 RepID=UPI00148989E2|nr:hypothetical protein [Ruegeria sp. HKCCA5491]